MIYKNRSSKWLRSSYILTFGFIGTIALLVAGCEKIKRNLTDVSSTLPGQETDSTKTITVQGWITNAADKKALPGASIIVEGLARGTTTDADGKFTINAPSYGRLIIGFVGFMTQVRPVNGISGHMIALSPGKSSDTETTDADPEAEPPARVDEGKIQTLEMPTGAKVYTVVEKQPQFPGGIKAMYQFLGENVHYPAAAIRASVSGRVFLSFVVTIDGTIKDVMVLKGIGFGCDEEAVRVVSSFPKWEPGTQGGAPVNVKYNLPIIFSLKSEDSLEKSSAAYKPDSNAKGAYFSNLRSKFSNAFGSGSEDYYSQSVAINPAEVNNATTLFRQSSPSLLIKEQDPLLAVAYPPSYVFDGKFVDHHDAKKILARTEPGNIESVSVFKGPSALSMFGLKGANGVIVIKTKEK